MLTVRINGNFKKANDEITTQTGHMLMITPPLDDDYWIYRVDLKHGQAIIAFPKFGVIGCGFAQEEDWNTNLPISRPAEEIYSHIARNKGHKDITKAECIAAIQAIQDIVKESQGSA